MALACTPPTAAVQGTAAPVPLPVVKMSCRSVSSVDENTPGRLPQPARLVMFGFASLSAGWEPAVGLVGTVVLLDVPPVPGGAPGAIVARAKMSYRLMPCTS